MKSPKKVNLLKKKEETLLSKPGKTWRGPLRFFYDLQKKNGKKYHTPHFYQGVLLFLCQRGKMENGE